jgi:Dolichyl-phosphate-mannose-protein mannosyltransferase
MTADPRVILSRVSGRRRTEPSAWLTRAVLALDILATIFVLAGSLSFITGGIRFNVLDARVSLRSPWRPILIAFALLVIRQCLVSYRPLLTRFAQSTRNPLPLDEAALFTAEPLKRRAAVLGGATLLFAALTAWATWPQALHLYKVPDLGDPLFSIWRLNWVHHQLFRDPRHLFDANIFHPERLTLTYSDSMLVPSLMHAPLLWLGLHRIVSYNVMILSAFVLSGLAMFLLVRSLTGRIEAALVAGALFTVYPYRLEHLSHLELQMTMWSPLALWGLHRTLERGRWRDGLFTGIAFAFQVLSSLYYGAFLAAYMTVMGLALWIGRRFPVRPLKPLVAGAVVAGVLVAPVGAAYLANKPMMGDREIATVGFYSAIGPDYLNAHHTSLIYRTWSHEPQPERQIFPRITPVVMSAVALWPPLSVARIGYASALTLALDGSLGMNGRIFPWLHEHASPFRGLRVPARFSVFAGMTFCILAGYGTVRLLSRLSHQGAQMAVTAALVFAVAFEAWPIVRLAPVWREPPSIYQALEGQPPQVLAEFPMPPTHLEPLAEFNYLYFSTFHWNGLVNGQSGFFPPSYMKLLEHETAFPSDQAVAYLKQAGVNYVTLHGAFYDRGRFARIVAMLDVRPDFALVAAAPWDRGESRLYRLK